MYRWIVIVNKFYNVLSGTFEYLFLFNHLAELRILYFSRKYLEETISPSLCTVISGKLFMMIKYSHEHLTVTDLLSVMIIKTCIYALKVKVFY